MKRLLLLLAALAAFPVQAATVGFAWDVADRAEWYHLCYREVAQAYRWDDVGATCVKVTAELECDDVQCATTWILPDGIADRLWFRVRAYNAGGYGGPSNEIDAWLIPPADMSMSLTFSCINCE